MLSFWKKKNVEMPEDLKVIESRLRMHGEKMPGPSEEFRGRLESRLDIAWDQREWSVTQSRYFAFVPQLAIACAVLVLAFVSADWTTRSWSTPQKTVIRESVVRLQPSYDMVEKEAVAPQKLFSSFAAPSQESAKAPTPRISEDYRITAAGRGSLGTASSMTKTEEVSNIAFLMFFVAYVVVFVIVWVIVWSIMRKRKTPQY